MAAPANTDVALDEPDRWAAECASIIRLCQGASVEMTYHDLGRIAEWGALLEPGSEIFVSHLPQQNWEQTVAASVEVRQAGFAPVPHVPARHLASARELDQLLEQLTGRASVEHVLLIAGDRAPIGRFAASSEVLRTGLLLQHGIRRLSVAGHPEGHPQVGSGDLRAAELEKVRLAEEAGLKLSFVTQFAFDAGPIEQWTRDLRARGVRNAIYIGLAGPARLSTLLQYALRCGVGPSIRALGGRAASFGRLLGERGPEALVRELARARNGGLEIDGIHLFSFGGLARTCRWIRAVQDGRFTPDEAHGFALVETG